MFDVIIIGKGPAGLSAALYTIRANIKTLVIGTNKSVLLKAGKIENYYGFDTVSGEELLKNGENQIKRLSGEIINDEVIDLKMVEGGFEALTTIDKYYAKSILLATGQTIKNIKIQNLDKFEGNGVSYCTTCDGFFYKNLKVGILGYKDYAIHEALEMANFTKEITIYTNGNKLELSDTYMKKMNEFSMNEKKIKSVEGEHAVEVLVFEDGTKEKIDGVFIAYDAAASSDFAKKLGILTEKSSIIVDRDQKTNVDGIYAAGDCTGGFKQISTAVGQGALAAKNIIEYIRSKK